MGRIRGLVKVGHISHLSNTWQLKIDAASMCSHRKPPAVTCKFSKSLAGIRTMHNPHATKDIEKHHLDWTAYCISEQSISSRSDCL